MQQKFLKRSFFQRFGFVFGLVSLLALVPTESHSQDDAAEPVADYHAMVKITDWNPDQNIGIAKIKKDVVVFKIDDAKTQIRVDQVLRCGQVNELDQLKSRTIWTFAKLDKYQRPRSTVGVFKPRLLLATGYGILPLPKGRVRVPPAIGLLGWYESEVVEWAAPGRTNYMGPEYDLAVNPKELVLVGTKGTIDKLKKGKSVHIDGKKDGKMKIRLTNKFIPAGKELNPKTVKEVPVIKLSRIVFMHKAFKRLYPFMFEDTFPKK